jgi:hypothetical protein
MATHAVGFFGGYFDHIDVNTNDNTGTGGVVERTFKRGVIHFRISSAIKNIKYY